ncbi:uncharacterized protein KIAA2012 homolog [Corythoichthys intestinalis]|uniref:uncharacterized protein KIAA2012 homolog n=1 Tax=Corythoichthys intestinalis TaxID=161448 RepID=UPI0025A67B24|nr:uncharacterized protein KIAA2012 homolog [Corythoichthys intestinalis]
MNENTERAAPMEGAGCKDKQDAKIEVGNSSPKEHVEEPPTGSTEEQEEVVKCLPLASSGHTSHFDSDTMPESGLGTTSSHHGTIARKAPRKEPTVGIKKDLESETADEAARGKDVKTIRPQEAVGQIQSRMNKVGNVRKWRQQGESDTTLTESQLEDKQTKIETKERDKKSTLSSVKKSGAKKGKNSKIRTKDTADEEKGRMEESTSRSQGANQKYKEDAVNVYSHEQLDNDREKVATEQESAEDFHLKSVADFSGKRNAGSSLEDTDHLSTDDKHSTDGSTQSVSSLNARSSLRSSCEGVSVNMRLLGSSHGQLSSSCSTVMVTEEQLMLNLVKTEASRRSREEIHHQAVMQEVEGKREQDEKETRQLQKEKKWTKDIVRNELEEERKRRAEDLRQRKLAEEEARRRREEGQQQRVEREQAERERSRRRQEGRRRQMEQLQKIREEEERNRKAEAERVHQEEQRKQEEEDKRLQEMDKSEREEYLAMKKYEEEKKIKEKDYQIREEQKAVRTEEESRMQAELRYKQMAFKTGLLLETKEMGQTQSISRPWVYSYFTLLQLLDLNPTKTDDNIIE